MGSGSASLALPALGSEPAPPATTKRSPSSVLGNMMRIGTPIPPVSV